MKTAVFSTHRFERDHLIRACVQKHELVLLEERLSVKTAALSEGCRAVSVFAHDDCSAFVLEKLNSMGVGFLTLRSAGFNHVDLKRAKSLELRVARVPEYSPYAVAEHAVALMLTLNRKIIRAHNRVMELNFLLDGMVGFDMHGRTAGIIGTGKIGSVVAKILHGFGCLVLAYDITENKELINKYGVQYIDMKTLCRQSDIITLHAPLIKETRYIISGEMISLMKKGVMLINTSRGGLVNTKAVIEALKSGQIGYFGMDVYEEEEQLFFKDHSEDILQDDVIARLMTFRNVLITAHQAFLTETALKNIAETTIYNLDCFEKDIKCPNELT